MAISRDNREYRTSHEELFNLLLGLLPQLQLRVRPYEAASPRLEVQNAETGQIKLRVQPASTGTAAYTFSLTCETISADRTRLKVEASTYGVTDLGLGQLTLRQILITVYLAVEGKLEAGQLPVFFLESSPPSPSSVQAQAEEQAHRGFDLGRRGYAEDALTEFQASLLLYPQQPEIFYHMGVLQMLIGRLAEAAQAFQVALELEPHHVLAGAYLKDLQARIEKVGPTALSPFTTSGKNNSTSSAPGNFSEVYRIYAARSMNTPLNGYTPGQGQAPAGTVNEEHVATRPIQLASGGWLFLSGDGAPLSEYKLTKPVTTLGRREDSDLLLMDAKVSRQHAEVVLNAAGHVLRDLRSANGTVLNGRRLNPGEEIRLSHGDRLRLGDIEITYTNPSRPR